MAKENIMVLDKIKCKYLILFLQTILTQEISKERVDALQIILKQARKIIKNF